MSVLGIVDAMRTDMQPSYRLVWICLENHANGHRFWAISTSDIATELHMSRDTVQSAILHLESTGVIRIDRHRRRSHVYHLIREYGPKLVSKKPTEPEGFVSESSTPNLPLMSVIPTPTAPSPPDLVSEMPTQTSMFESEKPTSTPIQLSEIPTSNSALVSEKPTQTPELMSEKPTVVESTSKNPTKEESTRARAGDKRLLPDDWQPNEHSCRLGMQLGMTPKQIAYAAEDMRDWAVFKAEKGTDWDRRFNSWLRRDKGNQRRSQPDKHAWMVERGQDIAAKNLDKNVTPLFRGLPAA